MLQLWTLLLPWLVTGNELPVVKLGGSFKQYFVYFAVPFFLPWRGVGGIGSLEFSFTFRLKFGSFTDHRSKNNFAILFRQFLLFTHVRLQPCDILFYFPTGS